MTYEEIKSAINISESDLEMIRLATGLFGDSLPRNHRAEAEAISSVEEPSIVCSNCHGTGGEPYDDGITPCEKCDGNGYYWWMS